jgi:lipopolysaccharide biosynthesis glycosyltransferase
VVYSDADVVFQENVENLVFETNAGVNGLALIKAGKCANQPEREQALMREHGKAPDDDYYFSGLAVLDLQKYNEHRLVQKSEEIARNSSSKLDFHDQTIWNCVAKEIESIDGRWCHLAYPGILLQYPPKSFIRGLIHFVGSPKPWDLLGEIYHPYSQIWVDAAKKAGLLFPRIRKYFQLYSWQRAWRIRKQYSVWKSQQNKK